MDVADLLPKRPTEAQFIDFTGEPFLRISDEALDALWRDAPNRDDLERFKAGFSEGSRRGLVLSFLLTWEAHWTRAEDHMILAHLASHVWTEGKAHSALAEFCDHDIQPEDVLALMGHHRCSAVIMDADDLEAYSALPDRFTVWRGGCLMPIELAMGHSWTTDRKVAEKFAERARVFGGEPAVSWRRVRKSDLIAYYAGRDEAEAVLWPSRRAINRRIGLNGAS
jgi:hypothetical protein